MLISRGLAALRAANLLKNYKASKGSIRNSSGGWTYRSCGKPHKKNEYIAEVVQGVAWWWVLWHLWTEPEHVFGEFDYPDTREWTDEELGIPSS